MPTCLVTSIFIPGHQYQSPGGVFIKLPLVCLVCWICSTFSVNGIAVLKHRDPGRGWFLPKRAKNFTKMARRAAHRGERFLRACAQCAARRCVIRTRGVNERALELCCVLGLHLIPLMMCPRASPFVRCVDPFILCPRGQVAVAVRIVIIDWMKVSWDTRTCY